MFAWWGTIVSRLRWLILVLTIAFAAFAGIWGTGVFDKLQGDSSLNNPASESQVINQRVIDELGRQSVDLIALYSSDTLTVSDQQFRDPVTAVVAKLHTYPSVAKVISYYDTQAPTLVSTDQHETYVAVQFVAGTKDSEVKRVRHQLAATGLTTKVGGQKAIDLDINSQISSDIPKAEGIGMPILLVLLILVLGSVVAGFLPVFIGGLAILGAFTITNVITYFTNVSIFSINIITILGLGLAVDYGLFIVSRFREELDKGHEVREAVRRTMATAGRTVAVSGLLVALALSSLDIFPQLLLRSMGFGGAAAVLVAMVASLTVLPALLSVLGPRVDALRLPWGRKRKVPSVTGAISAAAAQLVGAAPDQRSTVAPRQEAEAKGAWASIVRSVMRRPVIYTLGVLVVLLVLAAPFYKVQFGGVDERMLPPGTQSRVVSEKLRADFTDGGINPIRVLVSHASSATAADYQRAVQAVPGVTDTSIAAQQGESTLLNVSFDGPANSSDAMKIVRDIRALPRPAGADVLVGGTTASVVDQLDSLSTRLPWMALIVAGITFVLLAIAFGSLVVPIKAIIMNMLSIAAAFGVVTWVFQDGHLSGLLNFTPTGYVEASQPILMVAILFGLSMDYEVFLLSRIREEWDRLGDNTAAVASGVQRTSRIITVLAVLLCVVVGSFSISGITFIKMVGVGMVVALIVDATLIRLILVPATMRLLGRYNWAAPKFLHAVYGRYGVRESDVGDGTLGGGNTVPPASAPEPEPAPTH